MKEYDDGKKLIIGGEFSRGPVLRSISGSPKNLSMKTARMGTLNAHPVRGESLDIIENGEKDG